MKLRNITESNNLYHILMRLRPAIAQIAQIIYDEWDDDEYGGICDMIADEISGILSHNGIDNTDGGHDGDDHAYIIAYNDNESYIVDIPYDTYERGGGYNWSKIPNIQFTPNDVVISQCHRPDYI